MNNLAGAWAGFENWSLWMMCVAKASVTTLNLKPWTIHLTTREEKETQQKNCSKSCAVLISYSLFVLALSPKKCLLKGCIGLLETPGPFGSGLCASTLVMKNINKLNTDPVQMLKMRTFTLNLQDGFLQLSAKLGTMWGSQTELCEDHKRQEQGRVWEAESRFTPKSKELATEEGQTFSSPVLSGLTTKTTDLQQPSDQHGHAFGLINKTFPSEQFGYWAWLERTALFFFLVTSPLDKVWKSPLLN